MKKLTMIAALLFSQFASAAMWIETFSYAIDGTENELHINERFSNQPIADALIIRYSGLTPRQGGWTLNINPPKPGQKQYSAFPKKLASVYSTRTNGNGISEIAPIKIMGRASSCLLKRSRYNPYHNVSIYKRDYIVNVFRPHINMPETAPVTLLHFDEQPIEKASTSYLKGLLGLLMPYIINNCKDLDRIWDQKVDVEENIRLKAFVAEELAHLPIGMTGPYTDWAAEARQLLLLDLNHKSTYRELIRKYREWKFYRGPEPGCS